MACGERDLFSKAVKSLWCRVDTHLASLSQSSRLLVFCSAWQQHFCCIIIHSKFVPSYRSWWTVAILMRSVGCKHNLQTTWVKQSQRSTSSKIRYCLKLYIYQVVFGQGIIIQPEVGIFLHYVYPSLKGWQTNNVICETDVPYWSL